MIRIAETIFGPLIVPECRRSAGRSWVFVLRALAAAAAATVVLVVLWWWWFSQDLDPFYRPSEAISVGLVTIEGLAVALAVLITPAVLAGGLAGEKERGTLALLLTTRVNSWQIVTGRLGGKLAQVAALLLAAAPLGLLMAKLADLHLPTLLALAALPLVMAAGLGGLSLAASAVFRRGRDALLAVYLLVFLVLPFVLLALRSDAPEVWEWVAPLNPFFGVAPLVLNEDLWPSVATMLGWTIIGLLGLAIAAWRLRPACLRTLAGDLRTAKRRRWRVPAVNDHRPMLWKELFIERISPLGRSGRWLGLVAGVLLLGVSTLYAGMMLHRLWYGQEHAVASFYADWIGQMIYNSSSMVGYLIELAVGLRAAVAISSERERGTWDGLLTSPLQGTEIVVGKLCGSLYALRWLILVTLWAWTLALLGGAIPAKAYAVLLLNHAIIGACMAAVGVRISLAMATATKAMATTVTLWFVLRAALSILAAVIVGGVALLVELAVLSIADPETSLAVNFAWSPVSFADAWIAVRLTLFLLLTVLVVVESRYRFDRVAGRMTGGSAEVAVDRFLHGTPMAPVAVDPAKMGEPLPQG